MDERVVTNKELQEDEVYYLDKDLNKFCFDCAENTYTHCNDCGKFVKLTEQNRGICDDCLGIIDDDAVIDDDSLIIDELNISAE